MTFNPLVSCIIPVYNAEKYLDQGVKSLLNQTYKNIEIILVDDVSTDSSWEICQSYQSEYPNVLAFQNPKNSGGPLRGRERGIRESHGGWITFMDCDDYVTPTYIEHLVQTTEQGKYDIAVTGHSRLFSDGRIEDFAWGDYSQSTKERLNHFYDHLVRDDFWTDPTDTVGQNLVRASIAKKTVLSGYPNNVWAEDTLMALAFLANSEHGVNFVDYHDFYWRQIENSGSHGGFSSTANKTEFYRACFNVFQSKHLLPLVSVIVPVFNVEKYLEACVESVLVQTYPNLEIILVDDKTQDSSGKISDQFVNNDDRVKAIHKVNNEGLNLARATGFKASTGKYILFLDSDDMLTEDCVRSALCALLKNKADFTRFGRLLFEDPGSLEAEMKKHLNDHEVILKNKKDLYMTLFDQKRILGDMPIFSMTVWGALYTRASVERIDWREVNYRAYEDNFWTLHYLETVKKGVYLGGIGYLYRYIESARNVLSKSLTGNTFNEKSVGYLEGLNIIRNEFSKYNKKYEVGAQDEIDNETELLFMHRASHLTEANLWGAENNAEYVGRVLEIYQKRLGRSQHELDLRDQRIAALQQEVDALRRELETHLSIKRSAKLTAGNIKRRIMKYKKMIDNQD